MMSDAAPSLGPARQRMYSGSFLLFVFAEAMIFVTLFSTRFLLAGTGHPESLNRGLGLAITAILVASLVPLAAGRAQARQGKGAGLLLVAATLGAVALALIVFDWTALPFAVGSRYGENYVLSTFYHALHIALGLVGLVVVAARQRQGACAPDDWPVPAAMVFWTFVVVSWIALWLVFFIF